MSKKPLNTHTTTRLVRHLLAAGLERSAVQEATGAATSRIKTQFDMLCERGLIQPVRRTGSMLPAFFAANDQYAVALMVYARAAVETENLDIMALVHATRFVNGMLLDDIANPLDEDFININYLRKLVLFWLAGDVTIQNDDHRPSITEVAND